MTAGRTPRAERYEYVQTPYDAYHTDTRWESSSPGARMQVGGTDLILTMLASPERKPAPGGPP